ncbi:MAG: hypothetical protein KF778_07800 [Rhodocyclaceae bacterium]|nr:hypothetical protein [Rhodocyclaceae bacterium]MBX3668293.1 hypothetical protein [Rhodocyclaceae bacterium]
MIARLAFVLLIVLTGGFAWLAGRAAPPGLGLTLPAALEARLPVVLAGVLRGKSEAAPAAAPPAAAAAKAPAGADAAGAATEPPPLESLMIPSPSPAQAKYALRLGIFPDQAAAEQVAAQVAALHLPGLATRSLRLRDRDGREWWLAAAGEAAAPADLDAGRAWLEERLPFASMRVILLPGAPK